jgi:glycosyltransferase involved in cell wall biosynthesis
VKVLFYNHTGKVSGAERVLLMILTGLDRNRFDPVVLCPSDGTLNAMVRDLDAKTASIPQLDARFTIRPDRLAKYIGSFVRLIRAARAAVSTGAPDVVHANSIRAGLVMSAATLGLGVPVIWHVHDRLPRHPLSTVIRLVAAIFRSHRIIAVSQAVANRFEGRLSRFFRSRITTIHNAVDVEQFRPAAQSRTDTRAALGVEGKTVIGIVGQLTPRKGQLELIEAFAELSRTIPDTVLLIVGEPIFNRDGEYAASLESAAIRSGVADRIRFLGAREDVPEIMRALDLLVVNSSVEPFGLTVIEAMASKTPVLATAVDGIREIVRHAENGWLIEPQDRRSLIEGLFSLVRDRQLRERLSQTGRLDVVERFSTGRFLNEIEAVYRSVRGRAGQSAAHTQKLRTELSAD